MSNAWDALARFSPPRLSVATRRAAELHSSAPNSPPTSPDTLANLRERLRVTELEQIDDLAGRLRRLDLEAVADLLTGPEEPSIIEKAVKLGLASRLRTLGSRCWRYTVERGPSPGLHAMLSALLEQGNLRDALEISIDDFDRVHGWISADSIPEGLFQDRCAHPVGNCTHWISTLPHISTPVTPESALGNAVQRVFLTQAPAGLLASEGASSLLSMVRRFPSSTQEDFARHYLVALHPSRGWDEVVFKWISGRFGDLDFQNPVDFWRRTEQISEGILRHLAAWRALRTLQVFFKKIRDPHGRFAFWKDRFGERIVGAGTAAGGQAAYLHLPPLVVVEFANVGNAAYVYPDSHLKWIQSRRSSNESAYKDRHRLARLPGSNAEARIIHSDGWQRAAATMLNGLINARGGR